jgi:hypothetical protein
VLLGLVVTEEYIISTRASLPEGRRGRARGLLATWREHGTAEDVLSIYRD